jgi:hypothetical protein
MAMFRALIAASSAAYAISFSLGLRSAEGFMAVSFPAS